jgi:hypothetical protein
MERETIDHQKRQEEFEKIPSRGLMTGGKTQNSRQPEGWRLIAES